MSYRMTTATLTALLGSFALSGCVVAPPHQQMVYRTAPAPQIQTEVIYAEVAPPPPQLEVVGVAPPGQFWIGGFWLWQGGRHVWHPGHWEAHRVGYQWTPHQWVPSGRGWQMRGGFWAAR